MSLRPSSLIAVMLVAICLASAAFAPRLSRATLSLRLIYTANLRGVLEPCGCQPLQSGGLSRRAALLRTLRSSDTPTLVVDAGDNLTPIRPQREMVAFIFGVLRRLHYDVVNIGPFDLAVTGRDIRVSAEKAGLAIVAGSDGIDAERPGPPLRIVRSGGLRVALLGARPALAGISAERVIRQIARMAHQVRPLADVVVVLSQLPPQDVERCAKVAPDVDLFVSGRHDVDLGTQRRVSGAFILPCSFYGQGVGTADISLGANRRIRDVAITFRRLDAQRPGDRSIQTSVKKFYEQQFSRSPGLSNIAVTQRTLAGILGAKAHATSSCESCHRQAYVAWKLTPHAHAWQTLVQKGAATRADCISCHTTDPSTVSSFSPGMTGVSCAACHGGILSTLATRWTRGSSCAAQTRRSVEAATRHSRAPSLRIGRSCRA